MDRDAPPPTSSPPDVVPPVAWDTARKVGLAGLGLAAAAAALGLVAAALGDSAPWPLSTARLLLVFAGAVTAGSAVSLRPDLWPGWAIAAGTAFVGVFGLPSHWDSFRLLFTVLTLVAGAGAVLVALPRRWRVGVVSAMILFHFAGIVMATTTPPPTPWLSEQLYHRVYNPYLQFIYLRNAYHFYSPEPGPASLLCCLIKTETGEKTGADGVTRKVYDYKWIITPRRPNDVRDPLGLTYYRRLSLTEQLARSTPDFMLPDTFQKTEVHQRRRQLAVPGADPYIPLHPAEPVFIQYRLPNPDIMRFLLPSYAQHLILDNTPADDRVRLKTTIRLYRLEHRTLGVQEFVKGTDPYHPATYRPYFLGEFNVYGELLDPQDPMLYWLVPVIARPGGPAPGDKKKDYDDYFSIQAGFEFPWSELR